MAGSDVPAAEDGTASGRSRPIAALGDSVRPLFGGVFAVAAAIAYAVVLGFAFAAGLVEIAVRTGLARLGGFDPMPVRR